MESSSACFRLNVSVNEELSHTGRLDEQHTCKLFCSVVFTTRAILVVEHFLHGDGPSPPQEGPWTDTAVPTHRKTPDSSHTDVCESCAMVRMDVGECLMYRKGIRCKMRR